MPTPVIARADREAGRVAVPPAARSPGRLLLIGHPVSHSASPAIQNAALRSSGLSYIYEPLDVGAEQLPGVIDELRLHHAAGNVTVPHKRSFAALCSYLTAAAREIGAVNTFWHTAQGALVGDNTDCEGFARAVSTSGFATPASRVVCFGAGGAAAAVCAAVSGWPGATVTLVARSPARARELANRFGVVSPGDRPEADATLLVNATTIGMLDHFLPCPVDQIPPDADVMDLVYRKGETAWVRSARASGHRAVDGREMLIQQGALAFQRWTGLDPDLGAMRAALEKQLAV
ncbi:MAG: shikimate dehydrogenase family protein [Gemmatimonadota bacterium]